MKKKELKGKFVVAYDTMVDGNQCMMSGEEGEKDYKPLLFNSFEEAFMEVFDSNHAMLQSHKEDNMLKEYNPNVTNKMIKEMETLLQKGDVKAMQEFMDKFPECNDSGEWVEKADEFILGRKTIFTGKRLIITGTKLYKNKNGKHN